MNRALEHLLAWWIETDAYRLEHEGAASAISIFARPRYDAASPYLAYALFKVPLTTDEFARLVTRLAANLRDSGMLLD